MLFAALITTWAHRSNGKYTHRKQNMSQLLRSLSSLLGSQQADNATLTSLVLERLYYADRRNHPDHPEHGSFQGLSTVT